MENLGAWLRGGFRFGFCFDWQSRFLFQFEQIAFEFANAAGEFLNPVARRNGAHDEPDGKARGNAEEQQHKDWYQPVHKVVILADDAPDNGESGTHGAPVTSGKMELPVAARRCAFQFMGAS